MADHRKLKKLIEEYQRTHGNSMSVEDIKELQRDIKELGKEYAVNIDLGNSGKNQDGIDGDPRGLTEQAIVIAQGLLEKEKSTSSAIPHKNAEATAHNEHGKNDKHHEGKVAKLVELGKEWIKDKLTSKQYERVLGNLVHSESNEKYSAINTDKHGKKRYGRLQLGVEELHTMGYTGTIDNFLHNKHVQDKINEKWINYNAGEIVTLGLDKYIGEKMYHSGKYLYEVTAGGMLTAINLCGPGDPEKHNGLIGLIEKHTDPDKSHGKDISDGHTTGIQYMISGTLAQYGSEELSYEEIKNKAYKMSRELRKPSHNVATEMQEYCFKPGYEPKEKDKPELKDYAEAAPIVNTLKKTFSDAKEHSANEPAIVSTSANASADNVLIASADNTGSVIHKKTIRTFHL